MPPNVRFGGTHSSLLLGPFTMVHFPVDLAPRWINGGIYGCLSMPNNFTHQSANPLARLPQTKYPTHAGPDKRLPDKCSCTGIDISQSMHELFFGLEIQR